MTSQVVGYRGTHFFVPLAFLKIEMLSLIDLIFKGNLLLLHACHSHPAWAIIQSPFFTYG